MSTRTLKFAGAICVAVLLMFSMAVAQNSKPVTIRIGWVVPVANWGSILFAKPGIAQHLGKSYILEPVRFQGSAPMITAMATGDLDIGDLAYSTFALAIQNAHMNDLRVIADEFQDVQGYGGNEFMVLKDGPIRKVEDLKGKIIAVNAFGTGADIAVRAMLRKHGLDPNRDVTIIEVPFPDMKAVLAEKKVDLITGVIPFSFDPQLRAISRTLFTQEEAIGPSQSILWAARAGFLQKNHAAMVDFMEDALRAVHFYLDPANHDEVVQIASRVSKLPPQAFADWLFTKKDQYRDPNLLPNLKHLQANLDLERELGFLNTKIDVTKYADLSIVQEAAKRLNQAPAPASASRASNH